MKARNIHLTEEELTIAKKDIREFPESDLSNNDFKQKHLIVQDETAPLLYSKRAIWGFTFFFGALVGSILLTINLDRNRYKGTLPVLLFGFIASFGLGFLVTNYIEPQGRLIFIFNGFAALILNELFWNKYIGKETQFRRRSIKVPLAIGLTFITAIIIYVLMTTPNLF